MSDWFFLPSVLSLRTKADTVALCKAKSIETIAIAKQGRRGAAEYGEPHESQNKHIDDGQVFLPGPENSTRYQDDGKGLGPGIDVVCTVEAPSSASILGSDTQHGLR